MLGFDSNDVGDYVSKLANVILNSVLAGFGIYLLAIFSMWIFFPFSPKHEDFESDEERKAYFSWFPSDLIVFILSVIAATFVFSRLYT